MNNSLKLLSVNIEGDKHIDKIISLIQRVNPDVFCLQEVYCDDIKKFHLDVYNNFIFSPIYSERENSEGNVMQFGSAIFSKLPIISKDEKYYFRDRNSLQKYHKGVNTSLGLVISYMDIEKSEDVFRIATTHFCKSVAGKEDDFQMQHVPNLIKTLDSLDSFVVCGDFNAPRGMKIFSMLSDRFTDNIDKRYETSLDPDVHVAGPLPFMVDGLFSTPTYQIKNMYFETGVSDHYAIVAEISKTHAGQ